MKNQLKKLLAATSRRSRRDGGGAKAARGPVHSDQVQTVSKQRENSGDWTAAATGEHFYFIQVEILDHKNSCMRCFFVGRNRSVFSKSGGNDWFFKCMFGFRKSWRTFNARATCAAIPPTRSASPRRIRLWPRPSSSN